MVEDEEDDLSPTSKADITPFTTLAIFSSVKLI